MLNVDFAHEILLFDVLTGLPITSVHHASFVSFPGGIVFDAQFIWVGVEFDNVS